MVFALCAFTILSRFLRRATAEGQRRHIIAACSLHGSDRSRRRRSDADNRHHRRRARSGRREPDGLGTHRRRDVACLRPDLHAHAGHRAHGWHRCVPGATGPAHHPEDAQRTDHPHWVPGTRKREKKGGEILVVITLGHFSVVCIIEGN